MKQELMQKMRVWLTEQGLDAFLVMQPQNRSYLSGWLNDDTEDSGLLLVDQGQAVLLTNSLYQEVAAREAVGWQVVVPPAREYFPAIAEIARLADWQKLGFEASEISYAQYTKLKEALGESVKLIPSEKSPVETLRLVKRPEEIALLRQAAAITDQTFAHLCQWIQPGMAEKEIQWEITRKMVELGADGTAFESTVASGPNGSMPHAHASQRRVQSGELITIDMGARYKGYCADMTRTIC